MMFKASIVIFAITALLLATVGCGRSQSGPATTVQSAQFDDQSGMAAPAASLAFDQPSDCNSSMPGVESPTLFTHVGNGDLLSYSEGRGPAGHEAHTLQKHVAKTDSYLDNRLGTDRISAASTFPDQTTAEAFIDKVVNDNRSQIDSWLTDGDNTTHAQQLHLTGGCDSGTCGETLERGASAPTPESIATTYLYKECLSDGMGFFVMTAYPGT